NRQFDKESRKPGKGRIGLRLLRVKQRYGTSRLPYRPDKERGETVSRGKIRVAIIGVGNCASAPVQGVQSYREADEQGEEFAWFAAEVLQRYVPDEREKPTGRVEPLLA